MLWIRFVLCGTDAAEERGDYGGVGEDHLGRHGVVVEAEDKAVGGVTGGRVADNESVLNCIMG